MLSGMEFFLKEPFEKVLVNFDTLIKSMIRKYSKALEFDEMYQVGRIALWEAYERFDIEKGYFPAYTRRYVSGRFLQLFNQKGLEIVHLEDHFLAEHHFFHRSFPRQPCHKRVCRNLSERERLYVNAIILKQGSMKELARREGVSYETVRSWRKSALVKLRRKGEAMKKGW
ncbi:sigma-70 family RNA polymerase sigma factor [Pseudalkalibacillus sp. A8]|uniref:sigma-70 family RNA polymerase sigma factor n=1 Tax=Pseudalkalibacillus sp. A8 TaxID=3382641 RepID=UPI0038B5D18A